MAKFIKTREGAYYLKDQTGLQVVSDPRTLQSLQAGTEPFEQQGQADLTLPSTAAGGVSLSPTLASAQQPSDVSPQIAAGVNDQDPMTRFNLALLGMLRNAQQASGQEPLIAQQQSLQKAQIGRVSAITPEEQRVLSPTQQAAVRAGTTAALEPEIDAVAASIKSQDLRLQNFESILGTMRQMGADLATLSPSKDVITGYINMVRAGADFTSIPSEIRSTIVSKLTDDDWQANAQAKAAQKVAERAPTQLPSSYQEWQLAGGQVGTGKTYAEFLQTSKPLTQAQYAAAGYAQRMNYSKSIIDKLESSIASYSPLNYEYQTRVPNWLKNPDIQSLEQAESDFVNAKLRKESGAAIAPSEFERAKLQYFPLPGDTKETLAQKKHNRDLVTQNEISSAGGAYESIGVSPSEVNEIRVKEKSTGRTGTIPENEFDPNLYEKI